VSFIVGVASSVGNRADWEAEVFMAGDLTTGVKIYRPVCCPGPGEQRALVLETPAMEHFEDGTVMVRAKSDGGTPPLWQVVPWDEGGGRVCVCDEPIPGDWTYFEVLFADVNFVAVSPVVGDVEELIRNQAEAR
jgi:hypothetical protein